MLNNETQDSHWIKESRLLEHAVLKYLPPSLLATEAWGYAVAERAGMPTARLVGTLPGCLVMEELSGISCHRAISILAALPATTACVELLDTLWDDLKRMQAQLREERQYAPIPFAVYDVATKLEAVIQLMPASQLATALDRSIGNLAERFVSLADIPFRDANPKNCILFCAREEDIVPQLPLPIRRCHFDFRSLAELTTNADDYLSIILHPVTPADYRATRIADLMAAYGVEHVTLTALVRLARLWGRREYYFRQRPDLYKARYSKELGAKEHFWMLFEKALKDAHDLGLIR